MGNKFLLVVGYLGLDSTCRTREVTPNMLRPRLLASNNSVSPSHSAENYPDRLITMYNSLCYNG
jgi:hypothetical protein